MTSIEWLEEQLTYKYEGQTLNKFYDWKDVSEYYNKAKEMHKAEIMDAYMDRIDCTEKEHMTKIIGEEYYNKTFKKPKNDQI